MLIVQTLRDVVNSLAQCMPLRCTDESQQDRGFRLSCMLLQPGMLPAVLRRAENARPSAWPSVWPLSWRAAQGHAGRTTKWQISGGIAIEKGKHAKTVWGPLWIAVQMHEIDFTSSAWVTSYIQVRSSSGCI